MTQYKLAPALALLVALLPGTVTAQVSEDSVDFGRDVRPILADKCFTCHGPDENRRESGLRLDERDSAIAEADSGARAVVPGQPDASEMMARITSDDESMRMPPVDTQVTLDPEEIDTLRRWIAAGAEWDQHWAYVPPSQPEPPEVQQTEWVRNEIDRFILHRLELAKLSPAERADKITLLRRVTFDLTGLPPTLAEVDAFLADEQPGAYERVVNRLLASQHYGEHMARFWLDAARYGDTHGLHLDNYREMWPYRDWVVQAFNRNLPFDQFVIEQVAGDLLPDPSEDQLIATGFNRCHVTTNEGGSIREEVYVRNVVDRVVTFGTVFMGMTLDCTRCHDHKYDPLTQKDFYSLFAYFNSLDGDPLDGNRKDHAPVLRVPTAEQDSQLKQLSARIAELEQQRTSPWPDVDSRQAQWEQETLASVAGDAERGELEVGQWSTVGPFNDVRRYLFNRKHGPEGQAIDLKQTFMAADGTPLSWEPRPEWADGQVHQDLPGDMAANFLYRVIHSPSERSVVASLGSDDAMKVYLNGKLVHANDVSRGAAADQDQVKLELRAGVNELLIKIVNFGGATGFYFRLDAETATLPPEVLEIVRTVTDERTPEQVAKLREYFRANHTELPELKQLNDKQASLRQEVAEIERNVATTLVWREKSEPVTAHVLKRGEYDQPGDVVTRRVPAFLPPRSEGTPNDRLGLAMWLVDGNHPLTARVTVNRLWQQLFGTGLVKTSEDFGTRGERPSHPELLDWLAVQFVEDGWDVKTTLKRMVMSAAYQQSSQVTEEKLARDSANRLISRGPRYRLDAEMLRDQALAVSGLLAAELGGPSVKPPQPDGLWFAVGYSGSNTVRFKADEDPRKIHRRTLYTFIKRTSPPPQMSTFDGPSREACSVRRERTNTPLQALLLMNDPQFVEAAIALADRALLEGGDSEGSRATYMFRLVTSRPPTEAELADLLSAVKEDRETFENDPETAQKFLKTGVYQPTSEVKPAELAAWALQANMLLCWDEVVTKN